jgi:UDP:flavonoid glycosyltransferase YjiC (YdhE family)
VRVLIASTRGAGHFNPMVPFADACLRHGHDVLACGPPSLEGAVKRRGFGFWRFDDPPEDELDEVWGRVPSLTPEEQNELVVGEIFGRLDATASLPRLREACDQWRPDVVLRESAEFGSALAAELGGIPHARVGICLASFEELSLRWASGPMDELRRSVGLRADPDAETLRLSPYLTTFPESIEDPAVPPQPRTARFRDPSWDEPAAELPDWWTAGEAPLVYVTFGSVAGGMTMAAAVYSAAIEAVAELDLRALLTVGHDADLDAFGATPPNVRVESWVPQADVLAVATAVVCHGGSGSMLGALAAGLPLVVVPLFADQPDNARRVEEVGAGVAVQPDACAIREALRAVLEQVSYRETARRVAAELRSQASADAAVELLAELAA